MGALWVFAAMVVVGIAVTVFFGRPVVVKVDEREAWNDHARNVWRESGWYPHELADGTFRWYRVVDEVDHGRPAAR